MDAMNARDKSRTESLDAALREPVESAAYLEAVIEMDDPAALLLAVRQVAKAHGMAEVARRTKLGEKTLFRARLRHSPRHLRKPSPRNPF
jgi:DNA-binding phage protein